MPVFENGWICRECWSANREQDERCYRCHAVPKRREMPEPITFSTPDGKPNEERKKVSSLTAPPPPPAPAPEPTTPVAAEPAPPREFVLLARLRTVAATIGRSLAHLVRLVRAVPGAPRAAWQFATRKAQAAVETSMSPIRAVLSHRRAWLTAAWLVSALTSALLFSVALHASLAASLLVVASVAIFSGLSAAITTSASERRDRRAGDAPQPLVGLHEVHDPAVRAAAEQAAQPAPVLGSHTGR
ncbi:MAG: hypothetical protein WEB29_02045 [Chloroflexota bacterium]